MNNNVASFPPTWEEYDVNNDGKSGGGVMIVHFTLDDDDETFTADYTPDEVFEAMNSKLVIGTISTPDFGTMPIGSAFIDRGTLLPAFLLKEVSLLDGVLNYCVSVDGDVWIYNGL